MRQGLRQLADIVERIEAGGDVVEDASVSRDDEEFTVSLTLRLGREPNGSDGSPTADDATFRGDGRDGQATAGDVSAASGPQSADLAAQAVGVGATLAGEFDAVGPAVSTAGPSAEPGADDADSSDDEPVPCRVEGCGETFETEHGMKIHATKAHKGADGSAPSPHRDPERLREVYETHDTFAEMTEALDADVTAQTVRRSMMSLGVHDPDAADGDEEDEAVADGDGDGGTDAEDDGGEAVAEDDGGEAVADDDGDGATVAADGAGTATDDRAGEEPLQEPSAAPADAGEPPAPEERAPTDAEVDDLLPDAVDGEAFVAAVEEASTIHEVKRSLGMEREAVQTLLAELDLLDLVHGRVATEEQREADRLEIQRRIVERAGAG